MSKEKLQIQGSVTPAAYGAHVSKETKEATKKKIEELIKEETKIVRGIFQYFETPGGTTTVSVKKYPGIEPFKKTMTDGMMYEIPLYVARFLNGVDVSAGAMGDSNTRNANIGTCSYGVHGFQMAGANGQMTAGYEAHVPQLGNTIVPIVGITKRVKRFGFQSTEFGAFE
jgi:hypothetical protein